jgi:hypothetical protein
MATLTLRAAAAGLARAGLRRPLPQPVRWASISGSDIRTGDLLEMDGGLWKVNAACVVAGAVRVRSCGVAVAEAWRDCCRARVSVCCSRSQLHCRFVRSIGDWPI